MPAAMHSRRSFGVPALAAGALLLLLLALPAEAAVGRWSRFGPASGVIQALVADPFAAGILYAAVSPGDVYRSLDGGASWGWSAVGMPREEEIVDLAPDPLLPGTLYAVGSRHVFRSDDRGGRWTRVSSEGFQPSPPGGPQRVNVLLAAAVAGRGRVALYLAGLDRLWKSTDGGRSWQPVLAGSVRFLASDSTGAVYAGLPRDEGGGVGDMLRSTDGGASWRPLGELPQGVGIESLAIPASQPRTIYALAEGAVYRSANGGATWKLVLPTEPFPDTRTTALAVDPAVPGLVYAAQDTGSSDAIHSIRVSEDGGNTWRDTGAGSVEGRILRAVVAPAGRVAYAVSHFDLAASGNRGRTWSHRRVAASFSFALAPRDRLRFDPHHPGGMAAVAAGGLFLSADAGRTWRSPAFSFDHRLNDFAFDPVRPGVLYASTASGILRSPDGGTTWNRLPDPGVGPGAVAALDRSTLLAGGAGIARSPDRGRTWTQVLTADARPDGRVIDRFIVDPTDPARIYASGFRFRVAPPVIAIVGSELWRSTDGGLSWTAVPGLETVAFDPAHAGTLYAAGADGTIQQSLDGGESWTVVGAIGVRPASALLVDPAAPETLYAAIPFTNDLERSTDSGATWSPAMGGLRGLFFARGVGLWADPAVPHRIFLATGDAFFTARFP